MKTGRLIKFQRKDALVQAYLYQDGDACKAALYVRDRRAPAAAGPGAPADGELEAATVKDLEQAVRDWVDERFPR